MEGTIHAKTPSGLQSGSRLLHPTHPWLCQRGDGQESPWEQPELSMALQVTQAWAPSLGAGLHQLLQCCSTGPTNPSPAFRALIKSRVTHNFKPDLLQRKHTQIPSLPLQSPPRRLSSLPSQGCNVTGPRQLLSESRAGGIALA